MVERHVQPLQGYDLPDSIKSRIFYIRDLVIGGLIISVLLLRPQGLLPEERRVSIWVDREVRRLRRLRPEQKPSGSDPPSG